MLLGNLLYTKQPQESHSAIGSKNNDVNSFTDTLFKSRIGNILIVLEPDYNFREDAIIVFKILISSKTNFKVDL